MDTNVTPPNMLCSILAPDSDMCGFMVKYSANVTGIVLWASLRTLTRKSGLGDGHGSFYYCGNNILHFNSDFQIPASYKAPEVVII